MRFVARLIDGIIVNIVAFGIALAIGALTNYWVTGLFSGLLMFLYFLAFESTQGWTPGKKLLGLSDYDMFCTYSILESPMGVENYVATLRLTPVTDGDKTFLEWTAEFDCAPERETELVNNIGGGVFQGGFDALKRAFGG